ncbi:MAG: GGDEF domain-containing protein [Desulfobacterales bacterium]|nr:GGDEF domain-containing protein [Deltaproteobacteria bacterium]NNL42833.1 GGDEF domain-containing protein [Desulfobacterales bacterium]
MNKTDKTCRPEDEDTEDLELKEILGESPHKQKDQQECYLIIIYGDDAGKIYPLDKKTITIGRSDEFDIQVTDSSCSREQALIEFNANNKPVLKDLNSTNGTFVNGSKITETNIEDGDKIMFGVSSVFKFALQDSLEAKFQMKLYESSVNDHLTDAFNKKYFFDTLYKEFGYFLRHNSSLGLLMLDIDFFKEINDRYGHLAGDIVLIEVVKKIKNNLRNEDILCRYGGDEFAVIFRNFKSGFVKATAERIRLFFAGRSINIKNHEFDISVSIGTATMDNEDIATPEDMIELADANLYKAKHSGGNCVVI